MQRRNLSRIEIAAPSGTYDSVSELARMKSQQDCGGSVIIHDMASFFVPVHRSTDA
jgi:hypothetical protein